MRSRGSWTQSRDAYSVAGRGMADGDRNRASTSTADATIGSPTTETPKISQNTDEGVDFAKKPLLKHAAQMRSLEPGGTTTALAGSMSHRRDRTSQPTTMRRASLPASHTRNQQKPTGARRRASTSTPASKPPQPSLFQANEASTATLKARQATLLYSRKPLTGNLSAPSSSKGDAGRLQDLPAGITSTRTSSRHQADAVVSSSLRRIANDERACCARRASSAAPRSSPRLDGTPRQGRGQSAAPSPTTSRPASSRKPPHMPPHTPLQTPPHTPVHAPRHTPRQAASPLRGGQMDPLLQHGYQTLGPIAAGAFSQVKRARQTVSGEQVAVKTFNKQKLAKAPHLVSSMQNELSALSVLQSQPHGAIANLREVCEARSLTHAVLEYCGGGSLHRKMAGNLLRRVGLPEAEVAAVCGQLAAGLQHMHALGIVHRDVKPENVLFVDPSHSRVKLCDFGFAKVCNGKRCRTVCGSPCYMAPEVNGRGSYAGAPVDLWALGALAYEMIHAAAAFCGATLEQLAMRILKASHEPFSPKTSYQAKSFIRALLKTDPKERMTAAAAAAHGYIVEAKSETAKDKSNAVTAES